MSDRILVIGATGFTGSYVVPLLLEKGYQVACLVRSSSVTADLPLDRVELLPGDLNDAPSLIAAMKGADVLVNLASLGFGHAPNLVNSAVAAGIQRSFFISTTAINTSLNASSKAIRLAAEETIRQSELVYTILRPTMIYGSSRDRNICRLIRHLKHWPVIPVFGDGNHLQQPVYVGDVAAAVVKSFESDATAGRIYNISGQTPVTYNELIDTASKLMGRKVRKIHLPAKPCIAVLRAFERLGIRLPIKAEQVQRLNENKAFEYQSAAADFGYSPRSLAAGLRAQLKEMQLMESFCAKDEA
ncbi:MAG TPA: NAD-dependent epimerase/dehydratase family protein [Pyrinomonadaceae bacterium]|nr:NAD-dependent epimerase/dehydratase family protein [Pyrinomonadaceae bacterium]